MNLLTCIPTSTIGAISPLFTRFPRRGNIDCLRTTSRRTSRQRIARGQIEVSGEPSTPSALVVNAPGKVTADGLVAQIELQNAKAGQESKVRFRLANESDQPVNDLQRYLGARGHLVVISADGTKYVHAHPMDAPAATNEVVFMVHFPEAGTYKGWAQFQYAGQVRTIPFVVQIP